MVTLDIPAGVCGGVVDKLRGTSFSCTFSTCTLNAESEVTGMCALPPYVDTGPGPFTSVTDTGGC